IDGQAGQELIEGSASKDLAAYTGTGQPVSSAWPKVTTDWTVANPTVGSFGTLDTDPTAHKVVIAETRSGYIDAYSTAARACTPGDWPRFHHDNANSGDLGRDAVVPGKPMGVSVGTGPARAIQLVAPGDDLLCGTATSYQLATSKRPIDESNFKAATLLAGAPAPAAPGTKQSFAVPRGAKRYLAIRAVDDQGNVGRVASIDLGPAGGGRRDLGGSSGSTAASGTAGVSGSPLRSRHATPLGLHPGDPGRLPTGLDGDRDRQAQLTQLPRPASRAG
ncbi:MAG: hypothetical protein ACJ8H8_01225, partial [Geminicoccaceae bacterium]